MTRLPCEETFRRLDDFLDPEQTPDEMRLVREHLEFCGACSSEYRFEASVPQAVLDKESGRSGYTVSRWALSPDEVRRFGSVLAANPYACGFFLWKYDNEDASYLADPGVRSALAEVVRVAANRSPAPGGIH